MTGEPGTGPRLLVSRRGLLAIAAVVDIALHARPAPVSAKVLAARHGWPVRHLEQALQALVRRGVLKGVRGPRGGYALGRERRRITAGDIVRAALGETPDDPGGQKSRLIAEVVDPLMQDASAAFLERLDAITIEELCRRAEHSRAFGNSLPPGDFTI